LVNPYGPAGRSAAPSDWLAPCGPPPYSADEPSWTNRACPALSRVAASSASTAVTFAATSSDASPEAQPTALITTVGL
jgi:hypothetical protein